MNRDWTNWGLCLLWLCLAPVVGPMLVAGPLQAQAPQYTSHELNTNEAYDRRVMFNRLQTELVYIDRLDGEIPLDGKAPPASQEDDNAPTELSDAFRLAMRIALAIAVVTFLVLLYRNRGWLAERFDGLQPGQRPRSKPATRQSSDDTLDPALIARLRAMTDRRAALVELLREALRAAAEQNGMRMGRSETARELLRRLPRGWHHLPALRSIVMAEELVQFGGRPLADATFETCLTQATPILSAPPERRA